MRSRSAIQPPPSTNEAAAQAARQMGTDTQRALPALEPNATAAPNDRAAGAVLSHKALRGVDARTAVPTQSATTEAGPSAERDIRTAGWVRKARPRSVPRPLP